MLGFMAISGLLGQRNLQKLLIDVEVPEEIYARQETLLHIRLSNRRRLLPAFLIQISLGETKDLVILLRPGEEKDLVLSVCPPHRGTWSLPGVQISSIFPVNFFRRGQSISSGQKALVFPAPIACNGTSPQTEGNAPLAENSPAPGMEGELTNILPYQGEPLKMVHWRLSARQEELIVKRLARPSGEPVWLQIQDLPGRNIEDRLSCAAYLINRLLRQQQPVGLRLGKTSIPPHVGHTQRLRLLREIALYGQN